ncbi:hypothetical protein J3E68DRAFT_412603 [Trichoderma sp. SZMC 28012]
MVKQGDRDTDRRVLYRTMKSRGPAELSIQERPLLLVLHIPLIPSRLLIGDCWMAPTSPAAWFISQSLGFGQFSHFASNILGVVAQLRL